jgi:hypothetical protein
MSLREYRSLKPAKNAQMVPVHLVIARAEIT